MKCEQCGKPGDRCYITGHRPLCRECFAIWTKQMKAFLKKLLG